MSSKRGAWISRRGQADAGRPGPNAEPVWPELERASRRADGPALFPGGAGGGQEC